VLLDDHLVERSAELGAWCKSRLEEMALQHEIIGDVRGMGLMIGIELVRDRETKQPAAGEAATVRRICRERGVLLGVGGQDGNVVRIQPPLVIEQTQLERALAVLDDALRSVTATRSVGVS
jgi:4-aminobutyrate aminotransferase-like enzyme